ncbi:MAG: response regulator [Anaerolineae bacterium]|nr:response regulator [Anaerolineae bacterium]
MPRILVVDDELEILEVMCNWLALRRYDVLSASNSAEAIHQASIGEPDLVLLDASMPGVGGIETCRTLRTTELTRHMPVILITDADPITGRFDALMAGADDYVTRPVVLDDLNARIHILLSDNGAPVTRSAHLPSEVLETARSILSCDLVWLFAADGKGETLTTVSAAARWRPGTAPGLKETITLHLEAGAGRLGRAVFSRMAEFNLPLFDLPRQVLKTCQDLDLEFVSLIPLRSRNAVLGVLLIGGRDSLDIETTEGRQRAMTAVSQVTMALENAHLARLLSKPPQPEPQLPSGQISEEEEKRGQQLEYFWQILESVQQTASLDEDLQKILHQVIRMSQGALAMILLLTDRHSDDLTVHAAAGLYAGRLSGVRIPRNGIAGVVLNEQVPLLVNDARHDPHFMLGFDEQWGMQVETIVAAPLLIGGEAIGVLEVVNSRVGEFEQIDRDMLQGVAYLASMVIEKGRLFAALAESVALAKTARQPLPGPVETAEVPLSEITRSKPPFLREKSRSEAVDTDQADSDEGRPPSASELLDLILDIAHPAGHTPPKSLPPQPAEKDEEKPQSQQPVAQEDSGQIKTAPLPPLEEVVKPEMGAILLHRNIASLKYVAQSALESARSLAEQSEVDLVTIFDEFLPDIYMDRGRILDVIETLLEGAIGASSRGDYVKFVIRDIIDELQIRISYQETDLPIEDYTSIERVIEQHGGQFNVESDPEKGTFFTFTLPKSDITGMGDFLPVF